MAQYGKYFQTSFTEPNSYGICDRTGFIFNSKDLKKQMVWAGNNLVWTGWMVGAPYIDEPSQQNRPPVILDDPKPVKNPRVPQDGSFEDSPTIPPYPEITAELNRTRFN